jgi:ferredoxin
MPLITIDGQAYDIENGKRLVLAIEDSGIDILHRCGGFARCTTCRVKFIEGEPITMTQAEFERLRNGQELLGQVRLSCQILCDHDMSIEPIVRLANAEVDSTGPRPENNITPQPVWIDRPY